MNRSVVESDSGETSRSNPVIYDHCGQRGKVVGQNKGDWLVQVEDCNTLHLLNMDVQDINGNQVSIEAEIQIDRDNSSVDVIGCGCRTRLQVPVSSCNNLNVHNFVKVTIQRICKRYLKVVNEDGIFYTEDKKQAEFYENQQRLRREEHEKTRYYYEDEDERNPEDNFYLHVSTIVPLQEEEWEFVRTSCKAKPNLTALEAQLYIRDAWVARCYLEEHVNIQKARQQTIETKVSWKFSENKIVVTIPVEDTFRWKTVDDESGSWVVGSGLKMVHPLLMNPDKGVKYNAVMKNPDKAVNDDVVLKNPDKTLKDNAILMSIQKIEYDKGVKKPTIVTAVIDPTSRDVFHVVFNSGVRLDLALCSIGPHAQSDYSVASVIERRFNRFFTTKFFKVWLYGLQESVSEKNIDYRLPRTMDDDQLSALRTAVDYMGFSCLTGPPGSGKTHVACNLVKVCNRSLKTNFGISAHTNSAVDDIMSSEELAGLKICREHSKRATNTSTKESLRLSLYTMSQTPNDYLSEDDHPKVFEALREFHTARENLKITKIPEKSTGRWVVRKSSHPEEIYTLKEGLRRLALFRLAEKRLRTAFLHSYGPEALGSTPVIMSRRLNEGMERLIIDEATLMTPFESLALYCTMPHLKSVILIGDPVRHLIHVDNILLGDSQAATFMKHSSEFSRVTSLRKTKELLSMKLKTVYCTHPELVKHFFHPLYFSEFKSVWGLQDKLNQVKIMQNLKRPKKGTKGSDIRVICQNKAQAGFVQDLLKGDHGQFGSLELPCSVGTIWAMQGQKSKVVILLTTKVQKLWSVSRTSLLALWFSRAQNYLYVVGNFRVLCGERTGRWNTFIQLLYNHDALVDHELRVIDTIEDNRWYHGPNIGEKSTVIGRGLKMDVFQYPDFVR